MPSISDTIPEALHLLGATEDLTADGRRVLDELTGLPNTTQPRPTSWRGTTKSVLTIPQLGSLTYPAVRSAFEAAIEESVLHVRLEGDIGTGKSWLGELLTLSAASELANAKSCPWGMCPTAKRVLAFFSPVLELARERVRKCRRIIEGNPDMFPSSPALPLSIEAYSTRVSNAVLGENIVHAVFDDVGWSCGKEFATIRQNIERRIVARTGGRGPARVVDIEAFTRAEQWTGLPEGIIQKRDRAYGSSRLVVRFRHPLQKKIYM